MSYPCRYVIFAFTCQWRGQRLWSLALWWRDTGRLVLLVFGIRLLRITLSACALGLRRARRKLLLLPGGGSWFLSLLHGCGHLSGWAGMEACLSVRHATSQSQYSSWDASLIQLLRDPNALIVTSGTFANRSRRFFMIKSFLWRKGLPACQIWSQHAVSICWAGQS
jgi:hypothetical protein